MSRAITVTISESDSRRLDQVIERTGKSDALLARKALEHYLNYVDDVVDTLAEYEAYRRGEVAPVPLNELRGIEANPGVED